MYSGKDQPMPVCFRQIQFSHVLIKITPEMMITTPKTFFTVIGSSGILNQPKCPAIAAKMSCPDKPKVTAVEIPNWGMM